MASNEQIVESALVSAAAPDLVTVDYGDYSALQIAALQFINKVEQMINKVQHTYKILNSKTSIKQGLTSFYRLMRQSTDFTQEALILQHTFESRLNSFLGRIIYLAWVGEDGHLIYLGDANIGQVYAQATANRGRGNVSASKMKNIDINDLDDILQKRLQQSENLRAHVYQVAIERWSANKNEPTKNYDPSKNTFYWKLWDHHHITGWTSPIATKGIIAEGYAGAVINEDPDVVSSNLEYALKNLYNNHIQKDSIGAAIKGDITLNDNGNIQFAIKEGSFSTARFGQYLNLAYNIQQTPQLTVQEFQELLPKLVKITKATERIIADMDKKAEETADKIILVNRKI